MRVGDLIRQALFGKSWCTFLIWFPRVQLNTRLVHQLNVALLTPQLWDLR